jgi:DNA-binding NarL/FixJ family response regulator
MKSSSMPTALVVDDHPLFCDAVVLTLQTIATFESIHVAGTLDKALETLGSVSDISWIILDLNLPDVNGLDGLLRLRSAAPKAAILVASSMADNKMISRTLRAGANGFIPKHSQSQVFRRAYECVTQGGVFLPEGYIEPLDESTETTEDTLTRLASLTNQQTRILSLICEGKLNKQIAFDLSIAETTVKAHVTAIMRKLGVQSRTQAVLVAQEINFSKHLPTGRP